LEDVGLSGSAVEEAFTASLDLQYNGNIMDLLNAQVLREREKGTFLAYFFQLKTSF